MRRARDERERPDPSDTAAAAAASEALAAEVLAAVTAADVDRLIRAVGPQPRITVDSGQEQDGAGWPLLLRALGFAAPARPAWRLRSVNGGPALVGSRERSVVVVVVLAGAVGAATDVWIVANPDKLRQWNVWLLEG